MSAGTESTIGVQMCWDNWILAKAKIEKEYGTSLAPEPIHKDGCVAYFDGIPTPHWKTIRKVLDENKIPYRFIDRSETKARWDRSELSCERCEMCL